MQNAAYFTCSQPGQPCNRSLLSVTFNAPSNLQLGSLLSVSRLVVQVVVFNINVVLSDMRLVSQGPLFSLPSASPTAGAAVSDPRFRGFWGQSFYVGGEVGGVYNLLSDAQVQVNAQFVYLRNVSCPQVDGRDATNCFEHEGTYFGALLIRVQQGPWLRIEAGAADVGFHAVLLNDDEVVEVGETRNASGSPSAGLVQPQLSGPGRLRRGETALEAVRDKEGSIPQLMVTRTSARQLQVRAGVYLFGIDNVDGYVDLTTVEVMCWECLMREVQPEGLLGRTWNATASVRRSDEEVEEYREKDDDLLGCSHQHDRFCVTSQ